MRSRIAKINVQYTFIILNINNMECLLLWSTWWSRYFMIITSISSIDHYRPRAMLSTHLLLDPSRASLLHLRCSLCARIPTRSLSHNYQFRQCSIQNYAYFNSVNKIHFTMMYGNYCHIFIQDFRQKFSPCILRVKCSYTLYTITVRNICW